MMHGPEQVSILGNGESCQNVVRDPYTLQRDYLSLEAVFVSLEASALEAPAQADKQ